MARDYDTKVHKFRTSLFGFNRKDVVHYLERLNTAALNDREQLLRTHRDAEQMYSDLVRLNAEKKELTEKNTAQMEELATLKEKLKERRAEIAALSNRVSALQAELEAAASSADKQDSLPADKEPNRDVPQTEPVSEDKKATLEEEAFSELKKEYEKLCTVSGEWKRKAEKYDALRARFPLFLRKN